MRHGKRHHALSAARLSRLLIPLALALGAAGVVAPSASAIGTPVVIDGFGSSTAAASPFTRVITALPLPQTSTTPQGTFSASHGVATMTMSGSGNGISGTQLDYTPTSSSSVDLTGGANNTQVLVSFALVNQVPAPGQFATGVTVFMTATDSSGGTAIAPADAVGNYFAFNAAFPFTGFNCSNTTCSNTEHGHLDFTHVTHYSITFEYPSSNTGGGSLMVQVNELWATPTGGAPPSVPSPTVTAPATLAAPAGGTVNVTVSFSDDQGAAPVTNNPPSNTGLRAQDLTVGGTAFGAGTPSVKVTGGPSTYNVAISGMIQDGTLKVDVPAAVVDDAWGQLNVASSGDPTVAFTLAIAPVFMSSASATFAEATAGSYTVTTTGKPAAALSVVQGALPSGLSLTDNGNGTATISGSPDLNQVGAHAFTLQASNAGGTVPQSFTLTIVRGSQAALTLTSTSGTFGSPLTLTTSGGSGTGVVSYAVADGTASGCSEAGGALSAGSAGTCLVTATKAADANYNATSSPQTTVTFSKADQAGLTLTSTSGTFGSPLTLTTSGGSGTGAVSYAVADGTASACSESARVLTVTSAGTCLVTVTKAGDGNYNAASSPQTTVTVSKADQTALTLTSTSGTFGSPLTLATSGGSGTGTVSYAVADGTASGCSEAGGALSAGSAGTCLVTATKAADGNYNAASSPQTTVTFGKADQAALTLTSTSGTFGSPLTLTTSGGSGTGAVSYAVADGTASGCSESAGVLTVTSAGTCLVTATKATDTRYNQVSSSPTTIAFAKAPQSITVTSQAPVGQVVGETYTVAATADSGLPVAFSIDPSSGAGVCSISGAAVSFTSAGTCVVDADQAGNGNYLAAPQRQQTVAVTAPAPPPPTTKAPAPPSVPITSPLNGVTLPSNLFSRPPTYKAHNDGSFFVSVKLPGPGSVDVMVTAWKIGLAHLSRATSLLQPAPGRFVFARAHATAIHAGTLLIRVTPNAKGRLLAARHRPGARVRLWVTFTPRHGRPHSVGYYGILLP